jgi:hypothetical protein
MHEKKMQHFIIEFLPPLTNLKLILWPCNANIIIPWPFQHMYIE